MGLYKEADESREHMGAVDAAWRDYGVRARHVLSLALCMGIVVFIVWAGLAEIDQVVKGQGQVIPSQRVQVVQHLEGGILAELMVKEGDSVAQDQILARVDNVGASSAERDYRTRIMEHEAAIARLRAELEGGQPQFTAEMIKNNPTLVASELNTYDIRVRQQQEEDNIVDSQIVQREKELQESRSRQTTFQEAMNLAQQREARVRPLVQKKLYSEMDYLNLRQEIVRLKGEIDAILGTIGKIEGALQEARQRKELGKAARNSEIVKEINQRSSEMASLKENLVASTDKVTRSEVRSPVTGVVNRVLINTIGGIIKPGGEIMEITPGDDNLVIEVKITPRDIGGLEPGQKCVVDISAFDSSIYGKLDGVLEQIGADSLTTPQGETYYLVKVRTNESTVSNKNEVKRISPGMVASVNILTGKKTVLSYLLKPILKARDSALTER